MFEAVLFGDVSNIVFFQSGPGPKQRINALCVVILGLRFDVGIGLQSRPINLQRISESHLAATTKEGHLALRCLSMFLFFVGEAELCYRQHVGLEAFANQSPANTNAAEVISTWVVTNQIGVGSLPPKLDGFAILLWQRFASFHATNIQKQYQIRKSPPWRTHKHLDFIGASVRS